ncbi:MAG: 30S ribosomal protein S12 methylthiotransferase RimO [Verrucomicrobia bacterium]|nr:MAG: 30S ribosomal protein S12 methylthiotransferase RimO [Verrucomicrobiota bacterium]
MKAAPSRKSLRVGLISLGCAKNLVDSEIMLGTLLRDGVEIINDASEADVVIVNTCSFIDSAQEESIDTILESDELRKNTRPDQGLIVAGCLTQRFRAQLPKLLPEVDAFMGIDQVTEVTDIVKQALARRRFKAQSSKFKVQSRSAKVRAARVEVAREFKVQGSKFKVQGSPSESAIRNPQSAISPRPRYIPDYATPRFRLTPSHFAYVKIAEGCNHPCSFCTIPQMRGAHRSRPQHDILAEASILLSEGVKELNLISQDSTYYGMDFRPQRCAGVSPAPPSRSEGPSPSTLDPRPSARSISSPDNFTAAVNSLPSHSTTISTLLRSLNALPGDFWIRLLYTHPAHWTDDLIGTIAECPKVARYVDIPLQHIHHTMLERMRRETSQQYIVDLLARIRAGIPGIALRTTFIVGFPGETDAQFQALIDFIRTAKFERLGVFTYSQEESTRAGKMTGQLPEKVRRQRRDLAMAAQREVAGQISNSFVGRTIKVLVEKEANARDLDLASISSWEHGLIRTASPRSKSEIRNPKSEIQMIARGEADAPDIDGRVYIRGKLPIGSFAQVKVIAHTDYDLIAKPCGDL